MVVGGTVLTVNPGEPESLYDIAINASVFRQTASGWLTQKEQSVFVPGSMPVGVRVEVGTDLDALIYVLLHEATHLADLCERITEAHALEFPEFFVEIMRPKQFLAPPSNPFRDGVWGDRSLPVARYLDRRRSRIRFYAADGAVPADEIPAVYASLAATPFASLYGAQNPREDLAEYATLYHLTEVMKQPYRIVLHIEGIEILAYEPMKSDLVRSRVETMKRFYD